jgi:WD40 repeat protein
MRPILLQGHTRSLTQIKYNREGDLLFSVSKDKVANVWYSHNGERLGTYSGHVGAVWTIDVNGNYSYIKKSRVDWKSFYCIQQTIPLLLSCRSTMQKKTEKNLVDTHLLFMFK